MNGKAYTALESHFARQNGLAGALSILHWDSAVIMPESAASIRGEQLAAVQQAIHAGNSEPRIREWLDEAEAQTRVLDEWQRANLREMRHKWRHMVALDARLVREQAIATSESEAFWRQARQNNDFKGFLPYFQRVLALAREEAAAKADALGMAPYDALMDGYDSGTRMAEIDPLFARLDAELPALRQQAVEAQRNWRVIPLDGHYPAATQKELGEKLIRALGFAGRLDVSAHPFCGGVPGDVRITTRYNEADFFDALQGVLHETGHALYEQNLPAAWRAQPVGEARGMSTHESQSLFVEMQLCRSREFLRFAAPLIAQALGAGQAQDALSAENLYRQGIRVLPGFIRVTADEVTYPSHVILRYELEKDLISGALDARDLPEAWNAKMQEKLGITPPTDALGCLQDIHWPGGSFGYFPTYTLGAAMAAQWAAALRRDLPDWGEQAARGEFAGITGWLKRQVHEQASLLTRQELLQQATGEALNADIYLNHLRERYLHG